VKAEVKVTDVGPFKGTRRFVLDSSMLNVIEAPNASGKSSIIKGVAALLSLPVHSSRDNDVARRLGLVQENPDGRNPLVNLESKEAIVELITDGKTRKLTIPYIGIPKVEPAGDFRFLYTGLMLRESEIVRKLDSGSDEFDWLVSSLSLSKAYEDLRLVVDEYSVGARDELEKLKGAQKDTKASYDEVTSLKNSREKIRKTRSELEVRLGKILAPDAKVTRQMEELTQARDRKEAGIEGLRSQINAAKAEKDKAEAQSRRLTGQVSEYETELKKLKSEIDGLPSKEKIFQADKDARAVREEDIPRYREEIGKSAERVALLEPAEKLMKSHAHSVPCPLCSSVGASPVGMFPAPNFAKALQDAREKHREAQAELARAIRKASDLEALKQDVERQKTELNDDRKSVEAQLDKIHADFLAAKPQFETKTRLLQKLSEELENEQRALEKIRTEVSELNDKYGGKQRSAAVEEVREVEGKLGALDRRISDLETTIAKRSAIEVLGHVLSLDKAIALYEEWLNAMTELLVHIDDSISKQRRGAVKLFNDQAARVVKEMDFEGLKVWIDESSYRLRVQRQVGAGFRDQAVSSLSTSERHALAAVLTLAAKEAYAPDIPFLLVDEVLLDFDKKRLAAFVSYLREAAVRRGQLVLVSRLGGDSLTIHPTEVL